MQVRQYDRSKQLNNDTLSVLSQAHFALMMLDHADFVRLVLHSDSDARLGML